MKKFIKEIYDLRPWYHDFKALGIQTDFPPKKKFWIFGSKIRQTRTNMDQQKRKESVISPYIEMALDNIHDKSNISVLELFCSDGYYGFLTQKLCPGSTLVGVDINQEDINRCKLMSNYINHGPSTFIKDDVYHFVENADSFDLVLCFGGLYHITDPKRLLKGLRKITKQYLVVQSAITVKHDDPDYFESPNPWFRTWGALFTNKRLLRWAEEVGLAVLETQNDRKKKPNPSHVGASYALLK